MFNAPANRYGYLKAKRERERERERERGWGGGGGGDVGASVACVNALALNLAYYLVIAF